MKKVKAMMKGEDRVVTGLVRLSFAHLFEPRANDDGTRGKYGACLLIDKSDEETARCVRKAVEAAKARGLREKWGGKMPKKLMLPLQDGDEREDGREEFAGHWYLNAKSASRPGVVDRNLAPIVDAEEIYSGCYVLASLSFFPYAANGNNGVGASLDNVMKVKDGEALGGKPAAEADFGGVPLPEEDDDDEDL